VEREKKRKKTEDPDPSFLFSKDAGDPGQFLKFTSGETKFVV
jgi:hypothetical protein